MSQPWKQQYEEATKNPPKAGDVLRTYDGTSARLTVELTEGRPPFIYGRAHVPHIVGQPISGFVLQSVDTKSNFGWKCVLLPKAREEIMRRFASLPDVIPVKALKVIRASQTGQSLLCEVAEYAEQPIDGEFVEGERLDQFPSPETSEAA